MSNANNNKPVDDNADIVKDDELGMDDLDKVAGGFRAGPEAATAKGFRAGPEDANDKGFRAGPETASDKEFRAGPESSV